MFITRRSIMHFFIVILTGVMIFLVFFSLNCYSKQVLAGNLANRNIALRVSPTYIVARVKDGDYIEPIEISNTGSYPLNLKGFTIKGGHDKNGMPILSGSVESMLTSNIFLALEPSEFRLMPGESKLVKIKAHVNQMSAESAYPIIVFQGQATKETQLGLSPTTAQVGVLTLITTKPHKKQKPGDAQVDIESVHISQNPLDKSLTVSAVCHNLGNIHTDLSGIASIRSHSSQAPFSVNFTPVICLPGYKRTVNAHFQHLNLTEGLHIAEVSINLKGYISLSAPITLKVSKNGIISQIHISSSDYEHKAYASMDI